MNSVTINGVTYEGTGDISVRGGVVTIGGKAVGGRLSDQVEIRIVEGSPVNVTADGSVSCSSVQGNVRAGGSVSCDNVGGSVDAGGSVNCGKVTGSVRAGDSINHG